MTRHLLLLTFAAAALAQPGDLVANGDFRANADGWATYFAQGQAKGSATWQPRGQEDGYLRVTVESTTRESAVQIWRGPFAIIKGQRYLVTFEARAAEPILLPLRLMKDGPNYNAYGLSTTVPVGAEWQTYELIAVATEDSDQARLDFFGVGSFDLDNVSVRPAPSVELHPPLKVILGPGWNGDPQKLLDDDPKTEVNSGSYYPVPLFVIGELGEKQSLRQVVVGSRDSGEWVLTNGLTVEVDDGRGGWRRWAVASKRRLDSSRTEFNASSLAVQTARFRLRVTDVKNFAILGSVRVETGRHGTAAEQLPLVPEADDLAFVGWDYDRLGYDWSPGEALALRWQNNGDRTANVPLQWRLEAYHGDQLASGNGALNIAPGEVGGLPVKVPDHAPDGGAMVRVTFDEAQGGGRTPFYIDLRRAPDDPLKLRIVALFDSQDAEGWVRLMAGPLAPYLEVSADWPEGKVDAILVEAAGWPAGDDRLAKLEATVRAGTPALVFGAPVLATTGWLPAMAAGWQAERGVLLGDWLPARRHRVGLSPRDGAEVLQRWTDGTPAVVRGRVGQGTVVQFGLASGQTWLKSGPLAATDALAMQALYEVCGKSAALAKWAAPEQAPPNVGRFGWKLTEGGLVENLLEDGTVTCPADPSRPWYPLQEPFDGPPRIADQNWIAKTLVWSRGGQEALRATLSMASPYILWEAQTATIELPLTPTSQVFRPAGDRLVQVATNAPGVGWLLVTDTAPDRPDVPRLVIFQRRPQRVEVGDRLTMVFDGPCGAFWTGRPLGLNRAAKLSAAVCEDAARTVFNVPVDCLETASIDGDTVTVRDQFIYRAIQPDWPVAPRSMASLPPVMMLAAMAGAPLDLGGAKPTGCATKYGPLCQVPGESLTYTIRLPRREPFGVIPTAGDEPLREQMEYYGQQGALSVTRASGGMSLNRPFTADLLAYAGSGRYENPFESPCIDLYKWWYCFPTVQARAGYGDEARATLDAHWQKQYAETLNRYGYKCYVRHRREPYSKMPYNITFIWPTMVQDGVRYFVDQNESSAVIMECVDAYARHYGDWDTVAANWNLVRNLYDYLPKFHDWAWMASSNQEFFSVAGIDMLNSEYPGNLAFAEMARQLGYDDEATRATILAAKALVPAVARLAMPEYVEAITGEGDPWRNDRFYYSFDEFGLRGMPSIVMRGGPDSIMDLAIGLLDTSKGTTPEMALAYREWSPKLMDGYQRALVDAEAEFKRPVGWMHQMMRAVLGWPAAEIRQTAADFRQFKPNFGWQSAKAPSNLAVVQSSGGDAFLSEWLPAAYVSGRYEPAANRVILNLANDQPGPVRLKLFSKRRVTGLTVNGAAVQFAYDARTGWLTAEAVGQGQLEVVAMVGERVGVKHPYLGDG